MRLLPFRIPFHREDQQEPCVECLRLTKAEPSEFVYLWAPGKSDEFWKEIGERGKRITILRHHQEDHGV